MISISIHPGKVTDPGSHFASRFVERPTTMQVLADVICDSVWSPCVWNGGRRLGTEFLRASFCVLDFDSGEYRLEQARDDYCDSQHIIAPTKSHTDLHHRFRLILPFEKTVINAESYRVSVSAMIRKHTCDRSCSDAARFFYPSTSVYSINADPTCYTVDVIDADPTSNTEQDKLAVARSFAEQMRVPKWVRQALTYGVKEGERNRISYGIAFHFALTGETEQYIFNVLKQSAINIPDQEKLNVTRSAVKRASRIIAEHK